MDKEKKEKIALFRFGVISRLLWIKEDERQQEALLREITSTSLGAPLFQPDGSGTIDGSGVAQEVSRQWRQDRKSPAPGSVPIKGKPDLWMKRPSRLWWV